MNMDICTNRFRHYKQARFIEDFVSGSTGCTAEKRVNVNKTKAAYYCHRLREIISLETKNAAMLSEEFEGDDSYFDGTLTGKRGRGATGKVAVFGILKRAGKVFTHIYANFGLCAFVNRSSHSRCYPQNRIADYSRENPA